MWKCNITSQHNIYDKQLINVRGHRMMQSVTQALVMLSEPSQTLSAHAPSLLSWFNNGASPLLTQVCENHNNLNVALVCKLTWKPQLWHFPNFSSG